MSKVKAILRMALVIVVALLLAALAGVLVTRAEGPVIWKAHCPMHHEVQFVKDADWGGVHVLCVRMAEEVKGAR